MSKSTKPSNSKVFTNYETQAKQDGLRFVFGIDEAGRGPLAGPVVAAAVSLISEDFDVRIDDSKKLSEAQRAKAFDAIFKNAFVGIGIVSEVAIDELNILNASFHAMEIAVKQLYRYLPDDEKNHPEFNSRVLLLVDGNMFKTQLPFRHQTLVGGDAKCLSIACASIVAKVYRDRMMVKYDRSTRNTVLANTKDIPPQLIAKPSKSMAFATFIVSLFAHKNHFINLLIYR